MSKFHRYIKAIAGASLFTLGAVFVFYQVISIKKVVPLVTDLSTEEEKTENVQCDARTRAAANASSTKWITYHSEYGHYRLDYPAIISQDSDTLPPGVGFGNYPMMIDVSFDDPATYKNSLDFYVQKFAPVGMRLEKKVKIDGYDAFVTSYESDRKWKHDILFAHVIRGDVLFGIRTECVDHERVWDSFHFE